ncbi:uncharacterized protein LOC6561542 [Drosophila grimshawi]|uniref:GH10373 n=1 Tax=Drosophila grimshawi TaxID=7222 RepID=B4JEF8_DROGR|nr:uncharacterized protein LOC6561542 [Drosophila grimshawi]EDW03678.1 GH10373 [Drosophila grimshawi]
MKHSYTLLCLLLMAACLAVPSVARGGRGRGGGSFGGLFGGWRSKYGSKSSSSGGGRRVVSGSPVHTAMTVPKLPPPPPPPPGKMMPKPQVASYPRQQLPPGYSYNAAAAAAPQPQGTYYANAQTLPPGAVYYAQPPTSMSMGSGTNGFLTGMLAGRLMDSMLFGHHRQHVSHVYPQTQQVDAATAAGNTGRDIIIINNGQPQTNGEKEVEGEGQQQPLDEELASSEGPMVEGEEESEESVSSEETLDATATAAEPPVGGIVCFPIMLNETDPQNAELQREVERVICFPVPKHDPQLASGDCQNNPQCLLELSTTSTVPPIVAGDIGGAADVDASVEASSPTAEVDTTTHD